MLVGKRAFAGLSTKGSPFGRAPAKRVRGLFGGSKPPPYDDIKRTAKPNFPHSKIQISPPLPSLMILSKVSDSFAREASGIWSSLVWMLSPTSS